MRNLRQHAAYTLLEMTLVISIIGLIAGVTLDILSQINARNKNADTLEKIETIMKMVDHYADENGFIPCPARPDTGMETATFGFSNETAGACNTASMEVGSDGVLGGSVPVYTLGLPVEYAIDSWGMRLTFIVDADLRASAAYDADTAGNIPVDNVQGEPLTTTAIVAVISHGENNLGAYSMNGGSRITGAADDELANATIGSDKVDCFLDPDCDDIIVYKEIWNLKGVEE